MRVDPKKYLYDVRQAADLILDFAHEKPLGEYEEDPMLRSAVERQFEIIGEALAQLQRVDAALLQRITEQRRIIGFRNVLIHGYADVDHRIVWDIIQSATGHSKAATCGRLKPASRGHSTRSALSLFCQHVGGLLAATPGSRRPCGSTSTPRARGRRKDCCGSTSGR